MTTTTMNTPISVNRMISRIMRGAIDMLHNRANTAQKEHNIHADIKKLHELPPYLLRDIGISQDQIVAESSGMFHQRAY